MKFTNPIIPGFAPDPSVVRVEDAFFLVNSSFHLFPGLPIYASKDLRNWTHIGNAINRLQQLDLSEATTDGFPLGPDACLIAVQGLFAPTIRWHNGTFYVICTNSRSNGANLQYENFYVTSNDIWADEWSDPINFDFKGIDPSIYFEDDGRAYIQGSYRAGPVHDPQCTIRQFEVDISTGNAKSEIRDIWAGALAEGDVEGPHMYKKDGYYYLLAAEAGTFERHMITMARSKSIWGPFESYEGNPILTANGTDEPVQHVGHGDIFEDTTGAWWVTALGVRKNDNRYPLGRETFLVPVDWPTDGWPKAGPVKLEFTHDAPSSVKSGLPTTKASKRPGDVYIRSPEMNNYSFSEDGTVIKIKPTNATLSAASGTVSFIGRRQRSLNCTASVTLHLPTDKGTSAGLAVYKDDFRHTEIHYDSSTHHMVFSSFQKLHGPPKVAEKEVGELMKVELRIIAKAKSYEFAFRSSLEQEWVVLGSIDTAEMTALDFTGPLFGILAVRNGAGEGSFVRFENFKSS